MNRKDARSYYEFHSGKASDVARQLAFAGIALIWIFKPEKLPNTGKLPIPPGLVLPAALMVLGLAFDLFQYTWAAAAWGTFQRLKEKQGKDEFSAPRQINWPTLFFFWSKLAVIALAHILILRFLWPTLAIS